MILFCTGAGSKFSVFIKAWKKAQNTEGKAREDGGRYRSYIAISQ